VNISRPYAIFQNLMFSHLAVALLRYNRVAGGTQVVDVWFPEGARVGQMRITFKGDSGEVELTGLSLKAKTDANGWLRSLSAPAQSLTVEWSPELAPSTAFRGTADTVAPPTVRESAVTIASGAVTLPGTLTLPARNSGRIPAVVMVAGSGPTDRNGNSGTMRSNMYAQLAWKLAERGIASLRYDKRGTGASRASVAVATLTLDDFALDVAAAARLVKNDARFGPVALVGHSEGAWLALRTANSGAPVAGVALLSSLGRRIGDVLADQLASQIDSATARQFAQVFPRYLGGEDPGNVPESLKPLLLPSNRNFMKTLAAFDVTREIAAVKTPVLIVQGDEDIQAGADDAALLKAAKPDARVAIIQGANHFYKAATTRDRMVQLALYIDPTLPVVTDLVDELARWVRTLK
jgi:uncharacterized protein